MKVELNLPLAMFQYSPPWLSSLVQRPNTGGPWEWWSPGSALWRSRKHDAEEENYDFQNKKRNDTTENPRQDNLTLCDNLAPVTYSLSLLINYSKDP